MSKKRIPGCLVVAEVEQDGKRVVSCHVSDQSPADVKQDLSKCIGTKLRIIATHPFSRLENGEGEASALSALVRAFPPSHPHHRGAWEAMEELILDVFNDGQAYAARTAAKH